MTITEQALKYQIKRLNNSNIADLEKLHTAVYGAKVPLGFFARKYDTAFTGVMHTGFIAYNDSSVPIAFYGVIPCFMQFNDRTVLSAQSADTMTHPNYRQQGLFVELAEKTFDLCRTMGIRLLFGFPNQNSLPGFINKLGWQSTERMDCFRIKIAVSPLRHFLNKLPLLKKIFLAQQQRELKKVSVNRAGVPNSVCSEGFAGVYRDAAFLQYKTYDKSGVVRIGDAMVWVKINQVLLIGDMMIKDNAFDITLSGLKALASRLAINELQFHASPGTTLHRLFLDVCEPIPSFPVIFKDLGEEASLTQIKFTSADIDTF